MIFLFLGSWGLWLCWTTGWRRRRLGGHRQERSDSAVHCCIQSPLRRREVIVRAWRGSWGESEESQHAIMYCYHVQRCRTIEGMGHRYSIVSVAKPQKHHLDKIHHTTLLALHCSLTFQNSPLHKHTLAQRAITQTQPRTRHRAITQNAISLIQLKKGFFLVT